MQTDLIDRFDEMIAESLVPWLRSRGFKGSGRHFQLALTNGNTLLIGVKTSKWNRRQADHLDFVVEGFIVAETGWLTWYWKSTTGRPEGPYQEWERIDVHSDMETIADELKYSIDHYFLPGAKFELDHPSSPSLSGTRINLAEEGEVDHQCDV